MFQTNYCEVKQNMGMISEDTPGDDDRLPDFTSISGKVTFTPTTAPGQAYQVIGEDGKAYTVPVASVEADIIDGRIFHEGQEGILLFAAGKNSNPERIVYRVTYSGLRAGGIPVTLSTIFFEAVPGGVIDLTRVTPVPGAPVAGTIRGDKGDPFLYEDFTPEQLEALRGDPFTYEDFTPQQLADLKGDKGDPGEIPTPIVWVHNKVTDPTPEEFPKTSPGDIIERTYDGSRWTVDANNELVGTVENFVDLNINNRILNRNGETSGNARISRNGFVVTLTLDFPVPEGGPAPGRAILHLPSSLWKGANVYWPPGYSGDTVPIYLSAGGLTYGSSGTRRQWVRRSATWITSAAGAAVTKEELLSPPPEIES